MMSLPGTPTLFYGEEIGMGENLDLPGRMAVRTAMHLGGLRGHRRFQLFRDRGRRLQPPRLPLRGPVAP